ncbi:MAG: matrixin family metalloprotease [Muribaculaceae bacterium]
MPTICVYTLGDVNRKLLSAIIDSLQSHYPKCKFVGNIALPDSAITTKRNDHRRYRADRLNKELAKHKTDTNIVIGFTQADIGLDNFRGRAHSGIMGLASGYGTGVAVFSSYRPNGNRQLFSVMLHELGHAQGLRHCHDENCLMQDAKGGNPFSKTNVFCDKCKNYMQSRHWKL